jgi:uncharacterized protein (DUF58 family)
MMQRRNAAQNYYYFGLVLVGILLSTMGRRIEPLCVVLPLLLALIHSRLVQAQPGVSLQCTITPLRAFEGEAVTIQVTITATTDLPPTEIWHILPPGAVCQAGHNRLLMVLRAGEQRTFTHQVMFPRRGKYALGHLYCRSHPGADLQPLLAEYHDEHVCHIYPRLAPLPRHLPPLHTHISFGNYVSRLAGEGLEFAGVRAYTSGDRLRRVHWRTSLTRQQLYVNDYYCERNAEIVLLLDTLTAYGGPTNNTLDIAVRATASLAAHYLSHKDRVGLISYGGVCSWVPPALGQFQLYRILDTLLEARTHFSYLTKDITLIPPRVLPPGALIFVLTSFLDPRITIALRDLLARAFPLVILVISPAYAMPDLQQPDQAEAVTRLWRLETEWRLHEFRHLGVPVLLQETEEPLRALHTMMSRGSLWQRVR